MKSEIAPIGSVLLPLRSKRVPIRDFITVGLANSYQIIYLEDIKYLEADSNYTIIHTDEKRLVCSRTMKFYEEKLPKSRFVKIHRKYIVSFRKVECISKSVHRLNVGGLELPIAKANKPLIKALFNL